MTAKHTPTPWRIETWSYDNGARTKCMIQNDKDAVAEVLDLWCMDDRAPEREANAAHIVRCVNHHDELVAALTRALPQIEFTHLYGQRTMSASESEEIKATLGQARAILAKINQ